MICPACASRNDAGAKFCDECGASFSSGCSACGASNRPNAKFCSECGKTVSSSAASEPASAALPVAERRLVSVLFADLVGFTPFGEDRDAEDVRETLSRYFDLCSEIVGRYGGIVEKFIGDAVMAVWGAPSAHEDDAERAVRAALEVVDAVQGLDGDLTARAAVVTGEAAVTLGATNQGIVAGDLVNTAARLQSVAPPGTVFAGESTYRSASRAIQFEPAGEHELKGKQALVPAWRAVRVVAEVGGRNRTDELEPPFVGRDDELRLLKELFHSTERERRPRLISVMGPAGIGKSRLAWEFLKYIDGLVAPVYWHSGRSLAYGQGVTFWALGEMVRGRCELLETDDEATTRSKVASTVATWIPDERERERVEAALLTLLGIASDAPSDQLFAAWRTFFERIAENGTVVMVFEELQNADAGVLDFIEHLLEWSRGVPIYIVTLARVELFDRRPDWGAGRRSFTSIYLDPLEPAEMRDLLRGLIPGLPDQAVEAVVARADGIPLYAVETVRMLLVEGRIRSENGVFLPVGDLSALAVPDTLTALISSRLDALDKSDRAILQQAAVLGQSFSLPALAAVSGKDEQELEPRLDGFSKRELIRRESDPLSAERGQFTFVQALIREVAYNTLSRSDRKTHHVAAARYFEEVGSEELAGALASHYLAAYRHATKREEATALEAQARVALRAAAERAASLGAHDDAVAFYEQAVAIASDDAETALLLERAGRSARSAAKGSQAEPLLNRAIELYRAVGDGPGAARASAELAWSMLDARHIREALAYAETADADFAELWPDPAAILLKTQLARAHHLAGHVERAVEISDVALAAADRSNDVPMIAYSLLRKGLALSSLGRQQEALALINRGEQLARDHDMGETLLDALIFGALLLLEIDLQASAERNREGLELARRIGSRERLLHFAVNYADGLMDLGQWDLAAAQLDAAWATEPELGERIPLLAQTLAFRTYRGEDVDADLTALEALAREHGDPEAHETVLGVKADVALVAGRLSEARALAKEGYGPYATSDSEALAYTARVALWAGDIDGVRTDLEALDAASIHGAVVDARRKTMVAGIAALEGRDDALALYREAIRAWRELGVVWEEALTGIDALSVLDPGDPFVADLARSSRAIFERLDARPFIEMLDSKLAGRGQPASGVA